MNTIEYHGKTKDPEAHKTAILRLSKEENAAANDNDNENKQQEEKKIATAAIIRKDRYNMTTLAIPKNGPYTNHSRLRKDFKFSWLISNLCNKAIFSYSSFCIVKKLVCTHISITCRQVNPDWVIKYDPVCAL